MKFVASIRSLLLAGTAASLALTQMGVHGAEEGEVLCVQGYVIDWFCLNQDFYIDAPDMSPYVDGDKHTFKCMIDPPQCPGSGYAIMGDPTSTSGGNYTADYSLTADGTQRLLTMALAVGSGCAECTGPAEKTMGFRVGMMATVTDASATPPVVTFETAEVVDAGTDFCASAPPVDGGETTTDGAADESGAPYTNRLLVGAFLAAGTSFIAMLF